MNEWINVMNELDHMYIQQLNKNKYEIIIIWINKWNDEWNDELMNKVLYEFHQINIIIIISFFKTKWDINNNIINWNKWTIVIIIIFSLFTFTPFYGWEVWTRRSNMQLYH